MLLTENKTILYPEQYWIIWKFSFLALGDCIYAVHRRHYDLALVPGIVFLTSINYWRKPNYSWRRNIDIVCVKTSAIYQIIRAYNSEYYRIYYIFLFLGISFYPLSNFYYNKKLFWHSTYAHIMVHIFGNISNVILYSSNNLGPVCSDTYWSFCKSITF